MKKILLRILILLVVGIGATSYFRWDSIQQHAQPRPQPLQRAQPPMKLWIISVYTDGDSNELLSSVVLSNGEEGTVLDYYIQSYNFRRMTRSSYPVPQIDFIFASNGCVSPVTSREDDSPSDALLQAISELVEVENVDSYITIPCATDEVQLEAGREQIREALNSIYMRSLNSSMMFLDEPPLTEEMVEELLESLNFCEEDTDCALVYAPCPFGCRKVVNEQLAPQAERLMESYRTQQAALNNIQCEYDCISPEEFSVSCSQTEKKCVLDRWMVLAEARSEREQEIWTIVEPEEFTYTKADNIVVTLDREAIFQDMFDLSSVEMKYFYQEGNIRYNNASYFENLYTIFENSKIKMYGFHYTDMPLPFDSLNYRILVLENKKWYTDIKEANEDLKTEGAGSYNVISVGKQYLLLVNNDCGNMNCDMYLQLQQQIEPSIQAN